MGRLLVVFSHSDSQAETVVIKMIILSRAKPKSPEIQPSWAH